MFTTLCAGVCLLFATTLRVPCLTADDKVPADKPETIKPTIVFKAFEATEDSRDTEITLRIDLQGSDYQLKKKLGCAGSYSPAGLVELFDVVLTKDSPGWKFTANMDKGIIIVEGWTDPKTKKFYTVKSIKFDSKNLPKEYWPTIKMPPKPTM